MKKKSLLAAYLLFTFLLFTSPVMARVALDPSVVGVGARSLALGRSLAALDGGPDSIFLNPAGLAGLTRWGGTSMYTSLLNRVNYYLLGGVTPWADGVIGAGVISATIGGLQSAVRDPVTGRISFEAGTVDYFNDVYFLSYGQPVMDKLSAGVNLKLFMQGYNVGPGGTGYDADLGLAYAYSDELTIGFVQSNFLPAALGAKISWNNGAPDEGLATSSRLGLKYAPAPLNLTADYLIFPTRADASGQLHAGAEYWFSSALAGRVGLDQDAGETNLTAGLGFLFSDFAFDYAYHQYGDLSANTTHTFSLSYGVAPPGETPRTPAAPITVDSPADRSVIFEDAVELKGSVDPRARTFRIDGRDVPLLAGRFASRVYLKEGKNAIVLAALDGERRELGQQKLRLLSLKGFSDVAAGYWAARPISILAMEKLISGYPDGTFRPEGNITRAEFAKLLMSIKGIEDFKPRGKPFKDIPVGHWAAAYIGFGARSGLVKGYPDNTFRPNNPVTRAEGVAVIARLAGLELPRVLSAPFADVPGRHWAAREVSMAREAGLLDFLGDKFEPNRKLTRAEVVEILSKTTLVKPTIDRMLNFEEGY